MFDYLINKKHFLIQLGQYVSNEVIQYRCLYTREKFKRTQNDLNEMNRYELAYDFIENYVYEHYLEGCIDQNTMIDDIAYYLDRKIPQSYIKHHIERGLAPSQIDPKKYNHNLIYHFDER